MKNNLLGMFTNTWKFPISTSAATEALQRWGPPVVLHPRLSFGVSQGTNLVLQWQSAVNTSYHLQSSPDAQSWTDVGAVIAGNARVMSLTTPVLSSSNAYFRLRLN